MRSNKKNVSAPIREKYQPLLQECQDTLLADLMPQVGQWFVAVEAALMEAADRARDNRSQLRFIESIRMIRQQEAAILKAFQLSIQNGFGRFCQGEPIPYPFRSDDAMSELSLMDAAKVEDFLLVRKLADQFLGDWMELFYGLEQRLSMTRGGKKVDPVDIPGGPLHLAFAFQQAVKALGLDEAVYPALYELFGAEVLHNALPLYERYNQLLIAAGIFPNLKYVAEKQPVGEGRARAQPAAAQRPELRPGAGRATATPAAPPPAAQRPAGGGDPLEREVVDTISDLLSTRRSQDPRFRSNPESNPFAPPRRMVAREVLVDTLQQLQPAPVELPATLDSASGRLAPAQWEAQLLACRQQLAHEQQELLQRLDPSSVRGADLDVIEVVGLLFEQVLDEEGLPDTLKTLLSYLHTPYLKVGVLDPSFLLEPQHVARKLLNLMVHAGKHWVDEGDLRRGVYDPIKRCVERVLQEFGDDLGLFEELLQELWKQVERLERRAETLEQRARDAAGGQQRLLQARAQARQLLEELLQQRPLHPDLLAFFQSVWLERLSLMLLRNAEASETQEWQDSLTVINTLIMAYDGRAHPEMPERIGVLFPRIRDYIEKSLFSLGDPHQPVARRLFSRFEAFIGGDRGALEAPPLAAAPSSSLLLPPPPPPPSSSDSPHEQQVRQQLRALPFGTWCQLADGNGVARRLKLSWSNPNSGHFMFVDQQGLQALMINEQELVSRITRGEGEILTPEREQPFVSKALRQIRNLLSGLTTGRLPSA